MYIDEEDYLAHYGVLRRSGRYPWGSHDNEPQRNKEWLDYVRELEKAGFSQSQIAESYGMSVNELRTNRSISSNAHRQSNITMAQALKDKGTSTTEISRRMGQPEPTVRSWLAAGVKEKASVLTNTTNMLRTEMETKKYLDVGKGVANQIGISKTRLDTAVAALKQEGYKVFNIKAPQVTSGNDTNMKVLARPDATFGDLAKNKHEIEIPGHYSDDNGRSIEVIKEPLPIDAKRVQVVHKEDGGGKADGVIYVRPGVKDVSIGGKNYAQVRVAVGPDHYLKGMAVYKEDLPKGVDLQFNTNKKNTGNKLDAMKKNADESSFSEGGPHPLLKSIRRQISDPATHKLTSVMNIVNEEGSWNDWSNVLSSQMLSKQKPILVKSQLEMTQERRENEFKEISKLTNPTVRRKLLEDFADSTDSAAVHLKAAALPRQGPHVILPISTIGKNEIYAPGFDNGEKVVLIRHPHGGTFEIPELVVNNRNQEGKNLLGPSSVDAVGIHHETAQRLSGADFDGDTVLVIPNNAGRVQHSKALEDLKDFDPVSAYPGYEGMKVMRNTQQEMGSISNLITDMSLQNAPHSELARAVRHSMVVIDAEKKGLNHKESYNRNGIKQLKQKYQPTGGASTLISRARSEERVPARKPRTAALGGPVDKVTGTKEFEPKPNGRTEKSTKLAETRDARTLLSNGGVGTPIERLYAQHSNTLKALANKARLAAVNTPPLKRSPSAARTYKTEVDSLNLKLNTALKNAPLERRAQLIAAQNVSMRRDNNPDLAADKETLKKIKSQALTEARVRTGALKEKIVITDDEWNAIQSGAISNSKLNEILNNADMSSVRDHATPKRKVLMTPTKTARAKQMLAQGYTRAEVASSLGVSLSTLDNATVG